MIKGIGSFGKQYEIMYKNDVQAVGSVVRTLLEQMIKLDNDSAEYLYESYTNLNNRYKAGSRIYLENIVDTLKAQTDAETVDNITAYCRNIVKSCNTEEDKMIFGGTEEEILERGTYWCTDIARAACIMFQIAGLPSRIITTANTKYAYCGHMVTEVYYNGKWGLVDPVNGIAIRFQDGAPASAWEVHNDYDIANAIFYRQTSGSGNEAAYLFPPGEQYESVGISNYYVDEKDNYYYTTSGINEYYKEIFKQADRQWENGIKWIHGEEKAR